MLRFSFLWALCIHTVLSATAADAPKPTNVIILFVDDMGYADIGPFGNTTLRTPHLDRFAKEGMRFTHFYATPVCSMSRACLMTGSYSARVSMPGVLFPPNRIGLHPDEVTVAEVAKSGGYETMMIGKWHLGQLPEFLPTRQGFDHYFGLPYSNDMKQSHAGYPPLPLYRDEKVIETEPDQSQLTRRYTEEAIKFLRTKRAKPFFLYLPYTMIHDPVAASANFKGKSAQGLLGDSVEEIDWSVGQIMSALREQHLDENTLVIFTSDNGPAGRAAPPFSGNKTTNLEGGVREPCIMRWPGRIPAGTTCERIAGNIDVLPTLAKVFGAELPKDRILDGRDLGPLLADPNAAPVRDTHLYFTASQKLEAIRQGPWKLFLLDPAKRKGEPVRTAPALYDLSKDLAELDNVAAQHADIVARLKKEAAERLAEIEANKRPIGKLGDGKDAPAVEAPAKNVVTLSDLKPGAVLKAAAAPQVGGRAFVVTCTFATSQANTILLSHGGVQLGYALHIRDGKLTFSIRRGADDNSEVSLPAPTDGQAHRVRASLTKDGKLHLQLDDQPEVVIQGTGLISKQPAEDFSVGHDAANPAAKYSQPEPFRGNLTQLEIR
ncbi:MAG: sulfatase-like hydrolase/transferase [Verrucomicrobia bacterium]|nr:sulfatase-like hydrolase/transferase [Verrucomicrobiota bacterium]